jgi:hypothetical protein
LERIVYELDRLKKIPQPEVTWIFGGADEGQIEWADNYLNSYNSMDKVGNYYLGLTSDKNIVYYPFYPKEKYSTYFGCLQTTIWNLRLNTGTTTSYLKSCALFPMNILESFAANANHMLTIIVNC